MLPIALPPAIPDVRPGASTERVVAAAAARPIARVERRAHHARATVIATEPAAPEATVRFGPGLIVDTFA